MTQENTPTQPSLLDKATGAIRQLFSEGNKRRLELRNRRGETVLGLGLVWALVLATSSLVFGVAHLLAIAVVILIVMKYQFVVLQTT